VAENNKANCAKSIQTNRLDKCMGAFTNLPRTWALNLPTTHNTQELLPKIRWDPWTTLNTLVQSLKSISLNLIQIVYKIRKYFTCSLHFHNWKSTILAKKKKKRHIYKHHRIHDKLNGQFQLLHKNFLPICKLKIIYTTMIEATRA